jgi:hypothetical protein
MSQEEIKETGVILQSLAITLEMVLGGLASEEGLEVVLGEAV